MSWTPGRVHLVGVLVTIAVAVVLLVTVVPFVARELFTPALRGYGSLRAEPFYYLTVALIPVVLWLIPAFGGWLARTTYGAHKAFLGRGGFYVRFPVERSIRFRTTLVMALGPFALDMLAIVEIEYFLGTLGPGEAVRGLFVAPALLLLAGLITALVAGPWLVDALDVRLVQSKRGEVTRVAAVYEGLLGPVGAAALLVSFITTLHEANYSYEQGLFTLAVWAVRLFPPILAAVSIYRVMVEPRRLPGLRGWCDREGIPIRAGLAATLDTVRAGPPEASGTGDEAGPLEHTLED